MAGDSRALLTDGEKDVISGESDTTDNYRYKVRSNVRAKIGRLGDDLEFLEEYAPEIADELRAEICKPDLADYRSIQEQLDRLEEKVEELHDE